MKRRFERAGWAVANSTTSQVTSRASGGVDRTRCAGDTDLAWKCGVASAPSGQPTLARSRPCGAGALGVELGGLRLNHGELHERRQLAKVCLLMMIPLIVAAI
ncbi:hypothetical protein ACXX9E_29835, partial [Pseudomonas sp. GNP014]